MSDGLGAAVRRYRVAVLLAAAATLGWSSTVLPADLDGFAAGGRAIVSGHFGAVYAQAATQAGPLQLILDWLLMIGSSDGAPWRGTVAAVDAGLVLAAIGLGRRVAGSPETTARRDVLLGLLVLGWLTPSGLWSGHPVEVLVAVLWLVAVDRAGAGRWVGAGLALGLAVAIAPWGVLGFPAVLAGRRLSVSVRAMALGAAVAVALYLPFALSGHFAGAGATWPVSPGSLIHLIAPGLHRVTWPIRLVQAVAVTGGTAVAALLLRRHGGPAAVAVLVAAVLRVATDPVRMDYYWTSVAVVAIAIVAASPYARRTGWAVATAYAAWAGAILGWTLAAAGLVLALAVVLGAEVRRDRTQHEGPVPMVRTRPSWSGSLRRQ